MLRHSFQGVSLSRPVRLGVVLNPNARSLRADKSVRRIQQMLGPSRAVCTQGIGELPRALERLLLEQGCSVLGICGGDGTIHHTLNALVSFCQREQHGHRPLRFPPVLLLRGGTLNILARSSRVEGQTDRLLRRFLRRFGCATLGKLPITDVNVLKVVEGTHQPRYGFVFGSDITARCLELYEEQFGAGYTGLARFLQAVVQAYLFRNDLWHEFEPLLQGSRGHVWIDEERFPYLAVVASTIDIKLLGGLITGMHVDAHAHQAMGVRMLLSQTPGQLVRNLPNLVLGKDGAGILNREQASTVRFEAAADYSLDGEVFRCSASDRSMTLSSPSWTLPVVAPFP